MFDYEEANNRVAQAFAGARKVYNESQDIYCIHSFIGHLEAMVMCGIKDEGDVKRIVASLGRFVAWNAK